MQKTTMPLSHKQINEYYLPHQEDFIKGQVTQTFNCKMYVYGDEGVICCQMYDLLCPNRKCRLPFTGETDVLHIHTPYIAMGNEVSWKLVHQMETGQTSFTAFL